MFELIWEWVSQCSIGICIMHAVGKDFHLKTAESRWKELIKHQVKDRVDQVLVQSLILHHRKHGAHAFARILPPNEVRS